MGLSGHKCMYVLEFQGHCDDTEQTLSLCLLLFLSGLSQKIAPDKEGKKRAPTTLWKRHAQVAVVLPVLVLYSTAVKRNSFQAIKAKQIGYLDILA